MAAARKLRLRSGFNFRPPAGWDALSSVYEISMYAACCGSFPGVGNILSLTDVITCRFAIRMGVGLQMRKARNLREILSSQFI